MAKKVLILTASPRRDKVVDDLIAAELKKLGCEVQVHPCLREGREAVLSYQPDVVVVPPVRNPYSRDFVEQLKDWRCGVVSRHTEASCDKKDFEKLDMKRRADILGIHPYVVDVELVWGKEEADLLNMRTLPFRAVPVGSFVMDVYYRDMSAYKMDLREKYGFSKAKGRKLVLIGSPWGFADSAPDLQIDTMRDAKTDEECREEQIKMVKALRRRCPDHDFILSVHPGVVSDPYIKALQGLHVPVETELQATYLLANVDILIHAGSTMAMEMHALSKPAFQFQDTNNRVEKSWWTNDSPLSRISPKFTSPIKLANAVKKAEPRSNADLETLKILEKGRYGVMDGQATVRAAQIIHQVPGKFNMTWPRSTRDYDTLSCMKKPERLYTGKVCGICKRSYLIVNESYYKRIMQLGEVDEEKQKEICNMLEPRACPSCGARMYAQPG